MQDEEYLNILKFIKHDLFYLAHKAINDTLDYEKNIYIKSYSDIFLCLNQALKIKNFSLMKW